MLYLFVLALSVFAHAEPCPTYNEENPKLVVDVAEFKFFYYPRQATNVDPDIVIVEKGGEMFDLQKVYFWADDMADETALYNKNIDISCTYGLDFIGATYHEPRGLVHDYTKGACRAVDNVSHPLICDSAFGIK